MLKKVQGGSKCQIISLWSFKLNQLLPHPQTSGKAVVSLVFGITWGFFPLWLVGGIVALIVGYSFQKGYSQQRRGVERERIWQLLGSSSAGSTLAYPSLGICVAVVIDVFFFYAIGSIGL